MSVATATPSRQSVGSSTQTPSTQLLPEYAPPTFPLNEKAQTALSTLLRNYPTNDITNKLREANSLLTECAGDITERITEITASHEKKKARRARDADDDSEPPNKEEDDKIASLRERVEGMTKRMERELRKGIDGYSHCNALETAIKDLQRTAADAAATQATQAPSSAITLPGSTAPATAPAGAPSLTPALQAALERHTDRYTSLKLSARYASNNDYVGFKQIVHDAQYPADQAGHIPLPHARTWFADEEGAAPPQPGVTNTADDSDDDIAIDRENISTRCPITLAEFVEPVRSRKCPHSFEKAAILEMIGGSRPETGHGRRGAPAFVKNVQCPVTGCQSVLTEEDLLQDAALVRRIKRLQRAKTRAEEEGDTTFNRGGGRRDVEEIESDDGEDVDDVDGEMQRAPRASGVKIKRPRDEIEDD